MRNTILKRNDESFRSIGVSVKDQTITLNNGNTIPISVFIQPLTNVVYDPDKEEFSENVRWDVRRIPDEGVLDGIGCGLEEWLSLANAIKAQCAFA